MRPHRVTILAASLCVLFGACGGATDEGAEAEVQSGDTRTDAGASPEVDVGADVVADMAAPDGTGDGAGPSPVDLIDNAKWAEVVLDSDPFHTDGAAAPEVCPPEDIKSELTPEGVLFEVNTTFCAWLTVTQPLLADVPAGAQVNLVVRHAEIIDGETDYQLAVAMGAGANTVWSETVALFDRADEFQYSFTADRAYQAGDPVFFHLENHGVNTWNFVSMTALY